MVAVQAEVQYQQADTVEGWYVTNGVVIPWTSVLLGPTHGETSVVVDVTMSRRTLVDRMQFLVDAAPTGVTEIGSVADVRLTTEPGADDTVTPVAIVDFGALVTVSAVTDLDVDEVHTWTGTGFTEDGLPPDGLGEIATERLKLVLSSSTTEATVRAGGVVLPAAPTGLELSIAGTTVWFERQGDDPDPPPGSTSDHHVDRTDAFREAFRRAVDALPDDVDEATVRVELRSTTPGSLSLDVARTVREVHRVVFPDGPTRTITPPTEGAVTLSLPLPADALADREIVAVDLVLRADVGPLRTLPASGPVPVTDAVLTLRPGRALLALLPEAPRARLVELHGVRLLVAGGEADGELGGRLLSSAPVADGGVTGELGGELPSSAPAEDGGVAGDDGTTPPIGPPAEPIPGGDLVPTVVAAGTGMTWTTLELVEPVALAGPTWLELHAVSGSPTWALTDASPTDPAAPGASVRRRLPGGGVRELSEVAALGERLGCVRLVGVPDPNAPVPALELRVEADGEPAPLTPTSEEAEVHLGRLEPVPAGPSLDLVGSVAAPGSYTFSRIDVVHQQEGSA